VWAAVKVLTLNCGSSSVKYRLFDIDSRTELAGGVVEKIGSVSAVVNYYAGEKEIREMHQVPHHRSAIKLAIKFLMHPELGAIKDIKEIDAVGHRIVHGGEENTASVLLSTEKIAEIEKYNKLAPLHNPHNLNGVYICKRFLPHVKQIGVFDTAFHHTLPNYAYLYGIPPVLYRKHGIRKYGFHGISHLYVTEKTAEKIGKSLDELKIVTCHLGNGSSMAAVDRGRSVETTMGFTPLDGLLMGTRSGELDPAVIPFVMDAETLEVDEVMKILNKRSGLLGVSGVSNDVREIVEEMQAGNEQTALAMEMFTYRIKKYIGAFAAIMGGVDAITFTGGIGENSVWVRQHACSGLEFLGVMIEEKYNNENRTIISTGKSRVTVLVIPTNEELKIALETAAVIKTEVSRVAEEGTGWDRVCNQL